MPASRTLPAAALLAAACLASQPAQAETFRLQLADFQVQSAEGEEFLGVDFDFGHGFSEIEAVRLEIVLPSGIGAVTVSANSSTQSELLMVVHEASDEIDFPSVFSPRVSFLPSPLPPLSPCLQRRLPEITAIPPTVPRPGTRAGEVANFDLRQMAGHAGVPFESPNFLLQLGRGSLSLQHLITEFDITERLLGEGSPWGPLPIATITNRERGVNSLAGNIDSA